MNVFSLRAKTTTGKYYCFTALDAPVIANNKETILLGRKMSPKLLTETIVAGDMGIYVGDVLRDESGGEWAVSYCNGFVLRSLERRETKYFYDLNDLTVVRQATEDEWSRTRLTTPRLYYKYKTKHFNMSQVISRYRRDLVVTCVRDTIPVEEIQQDLCTSLGKQKLYLGDYYKGLPVLMCYGRICVQNEFGVYDLLNKHYIIK